MATPDPNQPSNVPFPTTRWSQVVAAGDHADPDAREALAGLCAAYWYPLYAFVRRKGHPPDEAADLVQGTFVNLLDRDGLAAVASERGRFRSFLMVACAHHLTDCRDRDRAENVGADGRRSLSIASMRKAATRPSRSMRRRPSGCSTGDGPSRRRPRD